MFLFHGTIRDNIAMGKPEIIVLDGATSNPDTYSEAEQYYTDMQIQPDRDAVDTLHIRKVVLLSTESGRGRSYCMPVAGAGYALSFGGIGLYRFCLSRK